MNERIKEILGDYDCIPAIEELGFYIKKLLEIKEQLKDENRRLSTILHNITINGVEEENTTVLDLIKENETLKAKLDIGKTCGFCIYYKYKSRCEKANEWIDKHTEIYTKNGISIIDWDNLSDPRKLKNILNGSDEK